MQFLKIVGLSLTLATTAATAQEALKEHSVSGPPAQFALGGLGNSIRIAPPVPCHKPV